MITESLENKSILVTGSTGFVGKLFAEKVLRCQPNVKQLFLLVRAPDTASAKQRLEREVIQLDILRVLRDTYGESFDSFFWNKVTPVAGDVASENFGIVDNNLIESLWHEVNVIVNIAANTNFNERYDKALGINTLGVEHTSEFAKRCSKLEMLLHVSTAYVTKETTGIVYENEVQFVAGSEDFSSLNIREEVEFAKEKLRELESNKASGDAIKVAMKELGTRRAKMFGWPNTYTFTKAMGEILLGELRGDLPVVIMRPTIITSTYMEPFPGWIEGVRTVDLVVVGYGMGKLTCFPGNPRTILDMVPGDMVVNAMCTTIAAHSHQSSLVIYHVGSSIRNPRTVKSFISNIRQYFSTNPYSGSDGRHVKVGRFILFPTVKSFNIYMATRYKLFLLVLNLLGMVFFSRLLKDQYTTLNRKYNHFMAVAIGLHPFAISEIRFDDRNSQRLRLLLEKKDMETFNFDTKCIDWDTYFLDVHIPGVLKYGMAENS